MPPRAPRCGLDFCEGCGSCLACVGALPCSNGLDHVFPDYLEADPESEPPEPSVPDVTPNDDG
jgi:hypothetical protein